MRIIGLRILLLLMVFLSLNHLTKTSVVFSQNKQINSDNSKRDLSLYEQGTAYDFSLRKGFLTLTKQEDEFREYLWRQWSRKLRTKTTAKFYTTEGDPTTSIYYIEPNENGRWQVVIDSESECCWHYAMQKPKKRRVLRKSSVIYNYIERVKEVKDEKGLFLRWDVLSTDEQLSVRSYRLRLKITGEESNYIL